MLHLILSVFYQFFFFVVLVRIFLYFSDFFIRNSYTAKKHTSIKLLGNLDQEFKLILKLKFKAEKAGSEWFYRTQDVMVSKLFVNCAHFFIDNLKLPP